MTYILLQLNKKMKVLFIKLPTRLQLVATLLSLLTLCDLSNGQIIECAQTNDCSCKFRDGTIIDISSLGKKSGGPRFTYALPDTQPSSIWEYAFNPCYKFSDSYCKDVVTCQRATDLLSSYPLGGEKATWNSAGTQITYESVLGPDGLARTTRLSLVCDQSVDPDNPKFVIQGEDAVQERQYDFQLTSICACPDGCKGGGGGGGGGISVGSILCIMFSVLVLVYIIGGMIYMKAAKGAEGKEIIPNVDFWMNFHNYVKDGVLFLKNKITGGSGESGYEDI